MSKNQKINLGLLSTLLLAVGFSAVCLFPQQELDWSRYSLAAAILYLVAHLVRSLRFYFNISVGQDVSIKNSIFINFTSNSIGNVLFFVPFVKEILILTLSIFSKIKGIGRIIFVIIYIRIFDLIFAITLFLIFHNLGESHNYAFYFIFFTSFLALLLLIFAYRIIEGVSYYCTKYHHNILTLKIVENLSSIKKFLRKKKCYEAENILLNILLTLSSWGLEMGALWLINGSITETVDVILSNVASYFDLAARVEISNESAFLFFILSLVSALLVIKKIHHEISHRQ